MKRILGCGFALLLSLSAMSLDGMDDVSDRRLPGAAGSDGYLLPNGWALAPAGEQIQVGDLPLAIVLHPDGKHLLVSNNGYGNQSIDLIDLPQRKILSQVFVEKAWLGLAINTTGTNIYAGGGMSNSILRFALQGGKIGTMRPIAIGPPEKDIFCGGLCLVDRRLYVANNLSNNVSIVDLASERVIGSVKVGDHPYTCIASPDGKTIFVSLWGAAQIAVLDPRSLKVTGRIPTDDHPNAMAITPDGKRLFVANANANSVSVIDVALKKTLERISVALYPGSPAGSTTNALTLSPDGGRLYAANADNNDVAVIDISNPAESKVLGFVPVGWYPTSLAISPDGKSLYVANGKGSRSFPNAQGPLPTVSRLLEKQYIGRLMQGTISIIPVPDAEALARYTEQVYKNIPYSEKKRLFVPFSGESAIPQKVGEKSAIKYVIYIIKENRTYDQVLGDLPQGNGDPSLTLFGEEVTPNIHALAREFVLLDNFYADAEVSADGHNWSMGAYATDYVEKTWPSQYSGRRRTYDYEGGAPIAAPSAGYLWDACKRAGVTYRSYGEWVVNGLRPGDPAKPRPGALEGHIDPHYRGWDLDYSDLDRARRFLSELRRFEKEGSMPQLQIVRLPNDHTNGTSPGVLTPRSYVAQNDFALGMVVEGITQSKFWPSTAIFVVEDDAQNGPDHVDAHRTEALAISPYIRRGTVDSTMYSTSSMVRTIELILGLPPMSQYDAAAIPMFQSFGTEPDLKAFSLRQPRVSLTDVNPPDAPGAQRSMELNFNEADAAPDVEFSEIIWKSVKGKDSPMPAPVRSAFVRPID